MAAHGQDLRRSPGLPDRGGLLAHAEYTTDPGGPTQRAPQRQADLEGDKETPNLAHLSTKDLLISEEKI
jgi:hypothetical protein